MLFKCICKQCNCEFENYKQRIFCSKKCANGYNNSHRQSKLIDVVCHVCGLTYKTKPCKLATTKCCSYKCKQSYASKCAQNNQQIQHQKILDYFDKREEQNFSIELLENKEIKQKRNRHLKGINIPCDTCGKLCYIKPSLISCYMSKERIKYCSRQCSSIGYGKHHSGENNPAFGKTYRTKVTHPEWAQKISNTSTGVVNVGDKNGMKNPEVASRMSKTRREKVTSDPEYRKARAKFQREAWASGKYDGVKTGLCKWYNHIKPDGTLIKLQGTWEVAYARYLDENKINYIVYSNPDKKLKILRREDLNELGINLQKIQIELLNKE